MQVDSSEEESSDEEEPAKPAAKPKVNKKKVHIDLRMI